MAPPRHEHERARRPMVTVDIPSSALLAVKHRALESPDEEICGAIIRGEHVSVDNVANSGERARRFRMDPEQQMKVWDVWKREGILIIYHSHPHAGSYPSNIDKWVITRSPDVIFLIYGVKDDTFAAYRFNDLSIVTIQVNEVEESTQQDLSSTVTNGPT